MARSINYESKIAAIMERIAKKEEELNALEDQLHEYEELVDQEKTKDLANFLRQNGITAEEAKEIIANAKKD